MMEQLKGGDPSKDFLWQAWQTDPAPFWLFRGTLHGSQQYSQHQNVATNHITSHLLLEFRNNDG